MLFVEIANTPYKLAKGLMFCSKLNDTDGMLFEFDKPQPLSFWGRNTFIPLDIAFVTGDGIISEIKSIKAMSEDPVRSSEKCKYAIEANLGFFSGQHIKEGYKVDIQRKNNNFAILEFFKSSNLVTAQVVQEDLPVYHPEDIESYLSDSLDVTDIEKSTPYEQEQMEDSENYSAEEEVEDQYAEEQKDKTEDDINENSNKVLRIVYRTKGSGGDRISPNRSYIITREIEPHGFYQAKNGNTILVSYDRTIGDIRAFIVSNILETDFLNETFEPKFIFEEN